MRPMTFVDDLAMVVAAVLLGVYMDNGRWFVAGLCFIVVAIDLGRRAIRRAEG
jgi:hypothetical protein